ncbi:TlpA family protein disulfide reductase [Sinomicrobium sp. M5D2P17]
MKLCITCAFFVILVSCKTDGSKKAEIAEAETNIRELPPKDVVTDGDREIDVYDFAGFERFLHRQDDKTYVINFWATWCKPCVAELPYFERLRKEYADKKVEVVLVSLDMHGTFEKKLLPFVREKKLESEVIVLDDPKQNDWISKVNEEWSGAIPATLIYNKTNRAFYESSLTYEDLENNLKALIDTK